MKIAIDIGHAENTGSVGVTGENEHDIAARVAAHLKSFLEEAGHTCTLIDFPDATNSADLNATVRTINAGDFDLSISLHCDSAPSPEPHGAHCIYYSKSSQGKKLAACMAKYLCALMPGRADSIVGRSLQVQRETRPVSGYCEMGFVTNPGDAYIQRNRPDLIASAIGKGILDYCESL